MRDGMFVFDNVIHMYDQSPGNIVDADYAQRVNRRWNTIMNTPLPAQATPMNSTWASEAIPVDRAGRLLFEDSDTDMVVAQTVPFFSYWKKGVSPVELNHALAVAYPERVILCGGVDPVWGGGLDATLREMERQVHELGASTFKFYNWQYDRGWRCDDREIAYPMYEKAAELGMKHLEFHKGSPIGYESMEELLPYDIQGAARDFPDLTFVIHHFGEPYLEETFNIASRFENVWVSTSAFFMNYWALAPDRAMHGMGRALQLVGPDRLLYGSEAFAWFDVQSIVDTFAELQISDELQDRYGYPPITPEFRRKMFGENQARLLGIDIEQKISEIAAVGDAGSRTPASVSVP